MRDGLARISSRLLKYSLANGLPKRGRVRHIHAVCVDNEVPTTVGRRCLRTAQLKVSICIRTSQRIVFYVTVQVQALRSLWVAYGTGSISSPVSS
jgi:hypothetical protein